MNRGLRTRWAAIGAAVAVALGAGSFGLARATIDSGERNVFVPITPCRLFDTRLDTNVGIRATPLGPNDSQTWTVWGTNGDCTVPSGATAIVINITVPPGATSNTFLTAWPTGALQPTAANLNVKAGDTAATPNLATVKLSGAGQFDLFNKNGTVQVIGDILGYFDTHHHDDRYFTKAEVDTLVPPNGSSCQVGGAAGVIERGLHTVFANQVTHCYRGIVATIGGLGGEFGDPQGAAAAANGDIIVADTLNSRIKRLTSAGAVVTIAGDGTFGHLDATGVAAKFNGPYDVAIAPNGDIVVADTLNHRIRRITPAGVVTTIAGGSPAGFADANGTTARFNTPVDVAIAPNGDVLVADSSNHRIRRITPATVVSTVAGDGTPAHLDGVGTGARFNSPHGIAIAPNGDVLVADRGNHRLRRITPAGAVTTLAGMGTNASVDGPAATAQFSMPLRIDVATDGTFVVTDAGSSRIRRIL